jgi:hypothetical protein
MPCNNNKFRKFLSLRSRPRIGRSFVSAIMIIGASFLCGVAGSPAPAEPPQPFEKSEAFQKLTPQQRAMVLPLIQGRQGPPAPGGEIRGFVQAALPGNPGLGRAALADARVFVQTSGGPDQKSAARTNSQGRFRLPFLPPGKYRICATSDGFGTSCAETQLGNQNIFLPQPITLEPTGVTAHGCVTLNNGSPASRAAAALHETAGAAEVSAVDASGANLAGPVKVNAMGCYVLPRLPNDKDLTLAVRYEQASARRLIPLTQGDL